jgi:general secretion pathway protein G
MRRKAVLVILAFVALALLIAAWLLPAYVDSVPKMREAVVRNDLFEMRAIISQYTLDLHRRPQTMDDLVTAGYLKRIPIDPMSGRSNTWVVEWSNDPKMPGIVGIRSGSIRR